MKWSISLSGMISPHRMQFSSLLQLKMMPSAIFGAESCGDLGEYFGLQQEAKHVVQPPPSTIELITHLEPFWVYGRETETPSFLCHGCDLI